MVDQEFEVENEDEGYMPKIREAWGTAVADRPNAAWDAEFDELEQLGEKQRKIGARVATVAAEVGGPGQWAVRRIGTAAGAFLKEGGLAALRRGGAGVVIRSVGVSAATGMPVVAVTVGTAAAHH